MRSFLLVNPYLYNSDGTKNYLAPRELRKTEDNFGIVRYKRKFFFVRNDYLILLDHEAPDQSVSYFTRVIADDFKFKESIIQDHLVPLIIPDDKGLYELAQMGVDMAVIFLRVKARSSEETIPIYQRALRLRTKYKEMDDITFSEASTLYKRYLSLHPFILHAKNKFLVHPFNSTRFLLEMRQVREFTINDYLTQDFSSMGFQTSARRKTIENHLFKNIFFHNCVIADEEFGYDNDLNSGVHFQNLEIVLRHTARWTKTTKTNLQRLANEVVSRMKIEPKLLALYGHQTIEEKALNLSIFMLLSFSKEPQIKSRVYKLFNLGMTKIGHLTNLP